MRKLFSLFVALLANIALWAYDFRFGDLYYNITSDTTVEVTYQEDWGFDNYSGLTTTIIPETITYDGTTYSVTSIGGSAFAQCKSLMSISIPNSVTSIGYGAFVQCYSLRSITIPDGVTRIQPNTFIDCYRLASVTIPNSVTSIENEAFYGCISLTSIAIPNSVTSIDFYAFANCTSLDSITIPSSVTYVGDVAFYNTGIYNNEKNWDNGVLYLNNCLLAAKEELSGAYIVKDSTRLIAGGAFTCCASLSAITIPNSVTNICDIAFTECSSLTSIVIGSGVTSIDDWVFDRCFALDTICCHSKIPPYVKERTFFDVERETNRYNATLYVPEEAWIDYKVHDIWGEFTNIQPMSAASVENTNSQLPTTNSAKTIRDNQLLILRDGKTYTVMGQEM